MEKPAQQPTETSVTANKPATEKAPEKPQEAVASAATTTGELTGAIEVTDTTVKNVPADANEPASGMKTTSDGGPAVIQEVIAGSGANTKDLKPDVPVDARPEYLVKNQPLSELFDRLPSIIEAAAHNEMWGVTLKDANDPPTANIMIKFLRANEGNVGLAENQLVKALQWRKQTNPLKLAESTFQASKFKGLGYITTYDGAENAEKLVFTWNIYGSVKDIGKTFGNLEEFINWRVALMELAIRELHLGDATSVMDYDGEDPYQMIQVHDYQNVSFLRMDPTIRTASRQTIEVFSAAYPELLKEKYFINVPMVMGWVFTALKVFLSKNTISKFHPITNGVNLAREFSSFANKIPKIYGGKGEALEDTGRTVAFAEEISPDAQPQAEAEKNNAQVPETTDNILSEPPKDTVDQSATVPTSAPADPRPN
ncbi:Non-classical phosphatidylinositol transfer protein (PITP) [Ophidiomyces ophidiicola]|nr:Non-classical phosphatidylinositol transfer protein (PITP) [Ophidiomyces ophidiicola]KAI2015876.1 Non-classical phosphatidylinositol transfer protein (PITP) [Ophidiomyces ophidiicola]KAI2026461.1 Non-classical phosphatidylinositol transfer protein (PITP) [Ophidiomyces ophidiicola]KAI2145206.1 Non-classical phosphatidylinositol transfer protein (PITP) [Ophidiomyces ophidiicola]KAI2147554.1 Non-classical phosphatidylinositol transfer protein (PITP) [Ophidiomyces ophidiicola]